jgi:hypothetical protein
VANVEGRIPFTNAQTLPGADSATKRSNPGCDGPLPGNNCQGDDWGWFRAGRVLYISYPEPWYHAYTDWEPAAAQLMASAQADPGIDFVVTYGHRPAYSSLSTGWNADLRTALTTLAAQYSPTAGHPSGKYVLTIGHHVHAAEVFVPIGGLTEINNGGGGAGQTTFGTPDPRSILRVLHPSVLRTDYDADAWTGKWGASPEVTVARDSAAAHTGSWSVLVAAGYAAQNLSSGYSDGQTTVTSAVAGTTYHGTVWVQAQAAGRRLTLRLREWSGSTLVTDVKVPWTATDTSWHQLAADLRAARSGTKLAFAVYADGLSSGAYFRGDDMSLTSP